MKADKNSMLLYVVTDRTWLGNNQLEDQVEDVLRSGATFLQLREKDLGFDDFVTIGKKIKRITDQFQVPFVINDNIEVAIAVGADGVHVGQNDRNAAEVRTLIGNDKILGVSVQNARQAILAEKQGADYLGVGAVFSTSTKNDADAVSLETLTAICQAVTIPVVAIGGINENNIMQLRGSGIDGVAVISAIFAKPDVAAATRNLLQLSKDMKRQIRGFIFDLDGTLLDSMGIWEDLGEKYLKQKNVTDIPHHLKDLLKPMGLLQAAEFFIEKFGIHRSPEQIKDEMYDMIEDNYKYHVPLKDGVRDFLVENSRRGMKMCIATATDRYMVEYALKRLDIDQYFDFIITSTEVGSSKENPDIYRKAAEKLGFSANEIVVFEDALHAIKTSKEAGFYTVGVEESVFEQEREKIIHEADCYIKNLNEFGVKI